MRIILLRHGESEGNNSNIITGNLDVNLTDKGIQQAKSLSVAIKDNPPTLVYVSDLKRAQQTWDAIAKSLRTELPDPIKDSALNERNFGVMTGKNKDWLAESMGSNAYHAILKGKDSAPGGESIEDVFNRSSKLLEKIINESADSDTIILVTHHQTLRTLVCHIERLPLAQVATMRIPNAAGYMYTLGSKREVISKTGFNAR